MFFDIKQTQICKTKSHHLIAGKFSFNLIVLVDVSIINALVNIVSISFTIKKKYGYEWVWAGKNQPILSENWPNLTVIMLSLSPIFLLKLLQWKT